MVVVLGLEETLSKLLALEFLELAVDGKASQVSILDTELCILSVNKRYCSFFIDFFRLELIQKSHHLIVLSAQFV